MCSNGPLIVVVMGVTGSGKTTVARAVAPMLGVPFLDGDDYHSAAARERMAAGEALTDADRQPWLHRLNGVLHGHSATGCVLACSALRRSYRRVLADGIDDVVFVALVVSIGELKSRITARRGHFAHVDLLASQVATLELGPDVLPVDGDPPADVVVQEVFDVVTERH